MPAATLDEGCSLGWEFRSDFDDDNLGGLEGEPGSKGDTSPVEGLRAGSIAQ